MFGALLNGSAWNTWRSQVTFSIVKLLYYLSAAPFTVFILGPLVKLISHAEPTGYTKNGRIVERDPTGLSAYVSWLKGSILESTRFENELKEDFSQADRQKLDKMVKDGEAFLDVMWKTPKSAKKKGAKKKKELDEQLAKIINRDTASDALYTTCFPNRVLVEQYKRSRQREKVAAERGVKLPKDFEKGWVS